MIRQYQQYNIYNALNNTQQIMDNGFLKIPKQEQQEEQCFPMRRRNPTLDHLPSDNPSPFLPQQPLQTIYLRHKSPPPPIPPKTHEKRYSKLFNQQNLIPYHLKSLQHSQVRITQKTSYRKWRSPLENKQKLGLFSNNDRLLNQSQVFQKDQVMLEGEMKNVQIPDPNDTVGYGEGIEVNLQNIKPATSGPRLTNPRFLARTGLQKLTKQFQQLLKQSIKSNKLAILPIESPLFLSHFEQTYSTQSSFPQDQILQKFKATNPHYSSSLRRDNPELVRRVFQGITNYRLFDIYSFIRYHVIFVTKQSNSTEKAYFLCNLFFEKEQTNMEVEEFERVLGMVCNNRGYKKEHVEKTMGGICRLLVEESGSINKSVLFRKLQLYQDVARAMIELLLKR